MKKIYLLLLMLLLTTPINVFASPLGTQPNPVQTKAQFEQVIAQNIKKKAPYFTIYKSPNINQATLGGRYITLLRNVIMSGKGGIDPDYTVSDYVRTTVSVYKSTRATFYIEWETSAEMEKEVDKGINKLYKKLKLKKKKTRYKKVRAIYDYIVTKVKYDYTYEKNSAYYAIKSRKTSCEGYAELFYRLCKKAKIPCHIVCGSTYERGWMEPHEWNIVKIKGKWYQVDATWDSIKKGGKICRKYFLKARLPYHTFETLNPEVDIKDDSATRNLSRCPLARKNYKK